MDIGTKIVAVQARKGLSGAEVARRLGTTPQQYCRWRKAKSIQIDKLQAIASALEVPITELIE